MTDQEDLRQYVQQKVQESNKILEQIIPSSCVKNSQESPRITALVERLTNLG